MSAQQAKSSDSKSKSKFQSLNINTVFQVNFHNNSNQYSKLDGSINNRGQIINKSYYLMSNANVTTKAISPDTIAEEIIGSLFCIVGFSITRLIAKKLAMLVHF